MTDLTVFLDRLTTDGYLKFTLEFYDDDAHAYTYTTKNSLIPRLADLSFGKYAMLIIKKIYVENERNGSNLMPFDRRSGLLQILLLNYGENGRDFLKEMLLTSGSGNDTENAILLVPIHPGGANNTTSQLNLYYLEY